MAAGLFPSSRLVSSPSSSRRSRRGLHDVSSRSAAASSSHSSLSRFQPLRSSPALFQSVATQRWSTNGFSVSCCVPLTPRSDVPPSTKLYFGMCYESCNGYYIPFSPIIAGVPKFKGGLSFRTTEESLRNAFQNFGNLVEVNLVMDRIANRSRGFAFLRYATEEESKKAIEGMHGKAEVLGSETYIWYVGCPNNLITQPNLQFLDGRVIFVEVAKPRSEVRQDSKQIPRRY